MTGEFNLINSLISKYAVENQTVQVGIGDDAAILNPQRDLPLVTCVDTLVSGVHFFPNVAADKLGYKSLAVNLSDFAAMAATPHWALLSLVLPKGTSEEWVEKFMMGFSKLANPLNIALVGGDTTQGPLSISVTLIGHAKSALTRAGANQGDEIWVTGTLGDAAYAVSKIEQDEEVPASCLSALESPQIPFSFSQFLAPYATSAIDLSDGLAGDLMHICTASCVGARVNLDALPLSDMLKDSSVGFEGAIDFALSGGDDFQLCFTASPNNATKIEALALETHTRVSRVGEIVSGESIAYFKQGERLENRWKGYEHGY